MRLSGLQPLTLIDYPGIIATTVFTQGCALRCLYCHNPELIPHVSQKPGITVDEVIDHVRTYRGVIEGIVITGGEPTIQVGLAAFCRRLKNEGMRVKLDTNGINPDVVGNLIKRGLVDYVAMDVKHVWEKYPDVIGKGLAAAVANCRRTMELLQASGIPHEFRTTVYPDLHDERDLHAMAAYMRPHETYALQPIRFGKTLDPDLPRTRRMDYAAVTARLRAAFPQVAIELRA